MVKNWTLGVVLALLTLPNATCTPGPDTNPAPTTTQPPPPPAECTVVTWPITVVIAIGAADMSRLNAVRARVQFPNPDGEDALVKRNDHHIFTVNSTTFIDSGAILRSGATHDYEIIVGQGDEERIYRCQATFPEIQQETERYFEEDTLACVVVPVEDHPRVRAVVRVVAVTHQLLDEEFELVRNSELLARTRPGAWVPDTIRADLYSLMRSDWPRPSISDCAAPRYPARYCVGWYEADGSVSFAWNIPMATHFTLVLGGNVLEGATERRSITIPREEFKAAGGDPPFRVAAVAADGKSIGDVPWGCHANWD